MSIDYYGLIKASLKYLYKTNIFQDTCTNKGFNSN